MDTKQLARIVSDLARITSDLDAENAKLRELASRAWLLFIKHGAVHPSDLPEVDAVRDGLCELGVEVDDEQHEL